MAIDPKQLGLDKLEQQYNLPSGLLSAVMAKESAGNPNAVSPKGAQGLFQFMPATAKAYGINPFDPLQSAVGAARMYGDLSKQFDGDVPSMLAAYNWGSGNLTEKGLQNAPAETRDYINTIMGKLGQPTQFGEGTQVAQAENIMNDGSIPPLPEGFEIVPPLPDGFELAGSAPKMSRTASTIQGAATALPFSDEIGAALGSWPALFTDKTVGQAYEEGLNLSRSQQKQAQQDNPDYYLGGQLGGALLSAFGGGAGLAKTAPQLSNAMRTYAAANPFKAGAIAGGVSGSIHGAGAGEGSPESRLETAAMGGMAGAAAGGLLGYAGQRLADAAAARTSKIAAKFGRKAITSKKEGAIAQAAPTSAPVVQQPKEGVLKLPEGVREFDVNKLRVQEEARQGMLGEATQQAQRKIDEGVVQETEKVVKSLTGEGDDADSLLLQGIDKFKQRFAEEKQMASDLMKIRNDKIATAKIYKDYTNKTLVPKISSAVDADPQLSVFMKTKEAAPIKEYQKILSQITKPANGGKFSKPLDFKELQGWSATVSQFGRENAGKQSGIAANKMVGAYNDWLDSITKEAFKSGDDDLVQSIFEANRNYSAFKNKYGTNRRVGESKILQDIVEKEALTPRQIVNMTFGKGVTGKDASSQVISRMLEGVDDVTRSSIQNDFRAGLVMRAYQQSLRPDGTVGLQKLATKIKDITKNDLYKTHLSDPQYDTALQGLAKDLGAYTKALNSPEVRSTSGTGGVLGRAFSKILENPVMARATGGASEKLNGMAQFMLKTGDRSKIRKMEKEFFNELDSAINSTPKRYVSPQIGATAGTMTQPEPTQITISPLPEVDLPDANVIPETN